MKLLHTDSVTKIKISHTGWFCFSGLRDFLLHHDVCLDDISG
jgi:hypothetical protein